MENNISLFHSILLIVGIILLFNLMIFVHELGHFLAARWRGLYVDRFQIWFGQAIWKKTINGVQWGVGWIPAGGFVSLPQMAPMESIEGDTTLPADLPPISPVDKIIVAFAGPLFSFLLALVFATIVWGVGKPEVKWDTTTIGYVQPSSAAAKAGLLPGDKILAIDDSPVTEWVGNMEGVRERIMLGENKIIEFTVQRPEVGEPLVIVSSYDIPETSWWQRRGMRQVGLLYASRSLVEGVLPSSPAAMAGLTKGDEVVALNGEKIWSPLAIIEASGKGVSLELSVIKAGSTEPVLMTMTPQPPINAKATQEGKPLLGIVWGLGDELKQVREHPTPWSQVGRSFRWMKLTMEKIFAPHSDVGVQHLAGPVGIVTQFYNLLSSPEGWAMALWFAVVLNINLAILNLLPIPVVDGGHIVLGIAEKLRGKPVSGKPLEIVQTTFVFVLMLLFFFISTKDIGDLFGKKEKFEMPRFEELPPQS